MNHSIAFVSLSSERPCRRHVITPTSEMGDERLLKLCLEQDAGAWHEFVRRFQPLIAVVIAKTLRRCTRSNLTLVDDLVQETFLKLCANDFKALREFDCRHEHALAGFLKVVASNVAQDYLRSLLSQKRGSGQGEDELDDALPQAAWIGNPAASIEQSIAVREIEQCLENRCSEPTFKRDSMIFWLYYRYGLTADAIARCPEVGLTVKGVESTLFRLTQFLRLRLGGRREPQKRPVRASAG